jgi:hypothetical protein
MSDWWQALIEVSGGVLGMAIVAIVILVIVTITDRRHYP